MGSGSWFQRFEYSVEGREERSRAVHTYGWSGSRERDHKTGGGHGSLLSIRTPTLLSYFSPRSHFLPLHMASIRNHSITKEP